MSLTAIKNTKNVALRMVTDQIKEKLSENSLQAVANGKQFTAPEPSKISAFKKALSNIFTITFSFGQNLHRLKVQLTDKGYGTPIYKVALSSGLSETARVCWLQKSAADWIVLLGNDISEKLKNAITSAIEDQA